MAAKLEYEFDRAFEMGTSRWTRMLTQLETLTPDTQQKAGRWRGSVDLAVDPEQGRGTQGMGGIARFLRLMEKRQGPGRRTGGMGIGEQDEPPP